MKRITLKQHLASKQGSQVMFVSLDWTSRLASEFNKEFQYKDIKPAK